MFAAIKEEDKMADSEWWKGVNATLKLFLGETTDQRLTKMAERLRAPVQEES